MIKYSFIFPYIDRRKQLESILGCFEHLYKNRNDIEILIYQDAKCTDNLLDLSGGIFNIRLFRVDDPKIVNPCVAYNRGISDAFGDIVCISNPEMFHTTDILKEIDMYGELDKEGISCGGVMIEESELSFPIGEITKIVDLVPVLTFCGFFSKKDLLAIGGFDEHYKYECCHSDKDFYYKITEQSDIKFRIREDLLVYHLNHTKQPSNSGKVINLPYFRKKWGRKW